MHSRKKKLNNFLVVWDMLGLESIFDVNKAYEEIDNWEKSKVWNVLKDQPIEKKPNPIPLQMLIMRARYNTQRSYEIYTFSTDMDMTEVKRLFKDNPQPLVEWIRVNGNKLYSDYVRQEKKLIV